jgi:peptide/nickel transport system permease protein
MIPTLVAISIISFTIIQLPPGDFLTTYVDERNARGETVDPTEVESLKVRFVLDKPVYIQYLRWSWNFLHGDFVIHSMEQAR